jgi:uncharacterized protein YabE (DUF348 family)
MKKTKTSSITTAAVLAIMAVGLILASATTGAVHAQTNSTVTNTTQGNQSASNSTNPLAKVPIIGKLFGGK